MVLELYEIALCQRDGGALIETPGAVGDVWIAVRTGRMVGLIMLAKTVPASWFARVFGAVVAAARASMFVVHTELAVVRPALKFVQLNVPTGAEDGFVPTAGTLSLIHI